MINNSSYFLQPCLKKENISPANQNTRRNQERRGAWATESLSAVSNRTPGKANSESDDSDRREGLSPPLVILVTYDKESTEPRRRAIVQKHKNRTFFSTQSD